MTMLEKISTRIKCYFKGHQWTGWEDMKFIGGQERHCPRCRLHVSVDADGRGDAYSYMYGSNWKKANPLRKE